MGKTQTETVENPLTLYLPEEYHTDVALLIRPTPEEMLAEAKQLPAEYQNKLAKMVARTRAKKPGYHTSSAGFEPIEIKVYHGTGADPRRPKKCVPGEMYSQEGRIIGEKFIGIPINIWEGRTKFPPRDGGAVAGPECVSMNRKHGSRYGDCDTCPFKPWSGEGPTGCNDEVVIHFVDVEFTGVYMIRFAKTSETAGRNISRLVGNDESIWDRAFVVETTEREAGGNRWYVLKSAPTDQETDIELKPMLEQFAAVIDNDVYYPRLTNTYRDFETGSSEPAEKVDEDALMSGEDNENLDGAM